MTRVRPAWARTAIGWRRIVCAAVLALLVGTACAKANIAVSVENGNSRGTVDRFEVYDVTCSRPIGIIALAGRTSDTIEICGDLGQAGSLRIRYEGELQWDAYVDIHSWSILTLPERPRSRRRPPPPGDDD